MHYVNGWVAAVPNANREEYRKHSEEAAAIFKEHGALKYTECWGVEVPDGEVTSFPMAVKCKEDETVVFSWMVWDSHEAAQKGMDAAMKDSRFSMESMPFDGKRMIWGGFEVIVDL